MNFIDLLSYEFIQNAIICSLVASILSAIIGSIIVEKKTVMLVGGIGHTTYGGVGLGYLLGIGNPIFFGAIFAVVSALIIGNIKNKGDKLTDVFISIFWSLGMALGIIFVFFSKGYAPELSSYLFGDILSITKIDVIFLVVLTIVVVICFVVFYKLIKLYLFDEELLKVNKIKVDLINSIILVIVALAVVTLIKLTGIMLVLSLIAVPTATSFILSKRYIVRIVLSAILGIIYSLLGLFLSYEFTLPSGATIIIVSSLIYFIVRFSKLIYIKLKSKRVI